MTVRRSVYFSLTAVSDCRYRSFDYAPGRSAVAEAWEQWAAFTSQHRHEVGNQTGGRSNALVRT